MDLHLDILKEIGRPIPKTARTRPEAAPYLGLPGEDWLGPGKELVDLEAPALSQPVVREWLTERGFDLYALTDRGEAPIAKETSSEEEFDREVERLSLAFPVLSLTAMVVMEALRGVREHRFSYYDAQVWAVARLGQVPVVLSEDFNPFIGGVRFVDPFHPAFDLIALD